MNILIVCQYFYPEEFKVNELAEQLHLRGHVVTVLTGKPTYPKGNYPKGYRFWGVQEELYKGIKVIRVPELTRLNGGVIGIILSMISFLISSSLYAKKHKIDADVIICFQLSPITMANPALIYKKRNNAKLIHWVQDLWPESVTATTPIKKGWIIKVIDNYVKKIYRESDSILVQSKAFSECICKRGNFKDKIFFAPNWADSIFTSEKNIRPDGVKLDIYKDDFIVMFAGNIGDSQDFISIIKAADLLKDYPNIKFIIVGDGRFKKEAERLVAKYRLSNQVIFLGKFPVDTMPYFFKYADAMLVTLKDEYIFSLTIPSKTQAYMAAGKPILTMLNGEGSNVVLEAKCGLVANSGDYQKLSKNIMTMSKMSSEERNKLGINGKAYYMANFSIKTVLDTVESLF